MPLLQYFGWVGSVLLAALLAVNWCASASFVPAASSDVPLDQKINIRIHTDHKWPERVVFDTTPGRTSLAQKADAETDIGASETPALTERQPLDAFAEMSAMPVTPCFRPPCSVDQSAEREVSPIENGAPSQDRSRVATRKGLIFPNPLRKPPGKS